MRTLCLLLNYANKAIMRPIFSVPSTRSPLPQNEKTPPSLPVVRLDADWIAPNSPCRHKYHRNIPGGNVERQQDSMLFADV